MWNPVREWREQREKDRQMVLDLVREITSASAEQARLGSEQLKMMNQFFTQFFMPGDTSRRVMNDEEEVKAEKERWGIYDGS